MTNQMTKFERSNIVLIRKEAEAALQQIAEKYGIQVQSGRGTFNGNESTMRFVWNTIGENGEVETAERRDLKLHHPNLVDTQIKVGGQRLIVIGYKSRNRKYPFIAQIVGGGARFKLSQRAVLTN